MTRENASNNTGWKAHRIRLALGGTLIAVFVWLWIADSLSNAINALVAVGTLGMAYFSLTLNRQTVKTEKRRIKPLCYCEAVSEREHLEKYGMAPKRFFCQEDKDGKEIDGQNPDVPLIFLAQIVNGGTGPACNVRLYLGAQQGRIWTECVPIAPVITPSEARRFRYEFRDFNIPPSEPQKRIIVVGLSSRSGSISDLYSNVSVLHLEYEDIEGNVYHSSLSLLPQGSCVNGTDDRKFQGYEPMTQFGDGKVPIHPWYKDTPPETSASRPEGNSEAVFYGG